MHYPSTYSSWLDQVERWFGLITQRAIRRGSFRSVKELVQKIDNLVQHYNRKQRPFISTLPPIQLFRRRNCTACGTRRWYYYKIEVLQCFVEVVWGGRFVSAFSFTENYDVVVVGAGHAGCEAAMAAARMGLKTALFTLNVDLIAQMSCNPAIGGIAKGHLVREVDALGGIMGEVTDAVGIQFRLLNTSRGPAVWSPRAQCDKQQYRLKMREVLESRAEPADQAGGSGGMMMVEQFSVGEFSSFEYTPISD